VRGTGGRCGYLEMSDIAASSGRSTSASRDDEEMLREGWARHYIRYSNCSKLAAAEGKHQSLRRDCPFGANLGVGQHRGHPLQPAQGPVDARQ